MAFSVLVLALQGHVCFTLTDCRKQFPTSGCSHPSPILLMFISVWITLKIFTIQCFKILIFIPQIFSHRMIIVEVIWKKNALQYHLKWSDSGLKAGKNAAGFNFRKHNDPLTKTMYNNHVLVYFCCYQIRPKWNKNLMFFKRTSVRTIML